MWPELPGEWIELPDARLYYETGFLAAAEAQALFRTLAEGVTWRQDRIRIFGREMPIPRLSAWYGDADAHYRYSGLDLEPLPWLPPLAALRERVAEYLAQPFNAVLLNFYRDGADGMGLHADDEPELGPQPVIATVSLGAARRFVLRHRRRSGGSWQCEPADGSLLVMAGDCQRCWRHGVPKTQRAVGGRISLTFRRVFPRAPAH